MFFSHNQEQRRCRPAPPLYPELFISRTAYPRQSVPVLIICRVNNLLVIYNAGEVILAVSYQLNLDRLYSGTFCIVVKKGAGNGIEVLHACDEIAHSFGIGADILHSLKENLECIIYGCADHVGLDAVLFAVILDVSLRLLILVITVHVGSDVESVCILTCDVEKFE